MSLIEHNIKTLKFARHNALNLIKDLSDEQLNITPEGYTNNIIWNFAHSVVIQKLLIYALSGQRTGLPKELAKKYRNGTRPEGIVDAAEIKIWKELSLSTVSELELDYSKGIFQEYKAFSTSTGFDLANVDDAITFNNYHEGLHYGVMMSLKKVV